MASASCVTRHHIDLWNERFLGEGPVPVSFGTVLRGSLLPIIVWLGVLVFVCVIYSPVVAVVIGTIFVALFLTGFVFRRRSGHSIKCSFYGAVGGVLDKSMLGF
ncbi:hypothetical protein ACFRQM_25085 [Streptomyces sp. NPDC056831]|uniref:hypothetical protein n=1 Tax=Streptomyces sp. NPDC056831 TaxID=3345954 RepID=UPI0036AE990C